MMFVVSQAGLSAVGRVGRLAAGVLSVCLASLAARSSAIEPLPAALSRCGVETPYLRPELEDLMSAVTLRVGFDGGELVPRMAAGAEHAPTWVANAEAADGRPQFSVGVVGRGLVLGSGAVVYPRQGNFPLGERGAVVMWIRPENWQRPQDPNVVFAGTTRGAFYLQRQGPARGDDGRVTRHEVVHYLVRDAQKGGLAGIHLYEPWQNDRWYFVVANWSWPTFEMSLNGGAFQAKSVLKKPAEDQLGDLVLGSRFGPPRGVIDEVLVFARPLSLEEAKLLYDTLRPR